jgi:UTP--glucose-1-phosphate uridylyltransferase
MPKTKPVKKAVFPVAGLGTRFLPATKANPKEMLPIIDKPIIQYAVEEAIAAGIEELIFVTSSNKRAIEDHFDSNFELETLLEKKGDLSKLKIVQHTLPNHVTCTYVRQKSPLGLGHAVLCAEHLIGDEPFVVILADDLLETHPQNCLKTMVNLYKKNPHSLIAVQTIDLQDSKSYGIIKPKKNNKGHGDLFPVRNQNSLIPVTGIVEKPTPNKAPSNLAVIGRYLFTPTIFSYLRKTSPGAGHEIQLTDAIAKLIKKESVSAYHCLSKRYDCGSKIGYIEATLAYGLQHPEVSNQVKQLLEKYTS